MSLLKQSYLGRGIALFFILFTFADLSIPELCQGELGSCSLPSSSQSTSNNQSDDLYGVHPSARLNLSGTSEQPQQQQSESGEHAGEDCFCCCSHIVPGNQFRVALLELKTLATSPADRFLPTSQPDAPFHPPRLS